MGFEMNMGERGLGLIGDWVAAKKNKRDIKRANQDTLQFLSELDFEPTYASQLAPTYKKAETPLASAYLESILTGDNPALVAPGETNAKFKTKAGQQATTNRWGTNDALVKRQRAIEQETPWKVTAPTEPVQKTTRTGLEKMYPQIANSGVTPELFDAYKNAFNFPAGDDSLLVDSLKSNLATWYRGDTSKMLADLQKGQVHPGVYQSARPYASAGLRPTNEPRLKQMPNGMLVNL